MFQSFNVKLLQSCDALVPSCESHAYMCSCSFIFEAKFGDNVDRRSVRINLLRLMFSNHHVTI